MFLCCVSSLSSFRSKLDFLRIFLMELSSFFLPQVPLQAMAPAKQRYYAMELQHFAKEANIPLQYPDFFPLRSVLPLRVTLAANNDPTLIDALCM